MADWEVCDHCGGGFLQFVSDRDDGLPLDLCPGCKVSVGPWVRQQDLDRAAVLAKLKMLRNLKN